MGRGRSLALPVICSGGSMSAAIFLQPACPKISPAVIDRPLHGFSDSRAFASIRVKLRAVGSGLCPGPSGLGHVWRSVSWGVAPVWYGAGLWPSNQPPESVGRPLVFSMLFRGQQTRPPARAERRALPCPRPLRSLRPPVHRPQKIGFVFFVLFCSQISFQRNLAQINELQLAGCWREK